MTRMKSLLYLVLFISYCTCDVSELQQKINLEDIERDNLISEQRSQQPDDVEPQQPQQQLRTPIVHASQHSYQIQHEIDGQHTNDAAYSRPHSEVHYQQHHGPEKQHSHQQQIYQHSQPQQQYQPQQQQQQLHHQQQHLQYVTIQPEQHPEAIQKYESQSPSPPQYTPVHEEGRTYSAPARHSLISPIQHTASATQSPYLAQQPQYVYVRAGPQAQQSQAPAHEQQEQSHEPEQQKEQTAPAPPSAQQEYRYASINQVAPSASAESYDQQHFQQITYEPQQAYEQNAVEGPAVTYLQPQATTLNTGLSGGYEHQPQPQYIQYIPYVTHGTAQQSYFMMVPTFRHSYVQPAGLALQYATHAQYAQPILQAPQHNYAQHQPQITVVPTDSYKHEAPAQEAAEPKEPVSTAQPSIQYNVQPSQQYAAQSGKSAHHSTGGSTQVEIQQSIEYPSRQTIEYTHSLPKTSIRPIVHHSSNVPYVNYATYQQPQQYQHLTSVHVPSVSYQPQYRQQQPQLSYHHAYSSSPSLDFFGPYNHKHSSLLASYVPSSVIVEKQRLLHLQQAPTIQHSNYHPSSSDESSLTSTPLHPVLSEQHSNAYNTIAYSAPHGYNYNHLKRSAKILPSTATVKAPTAATTIKATKLTKV